VVFCDCTFLKSVKLPSGIKKIGQSAFAHTRIEKIRIPNTVTSIEKWAFCDCTGLTNLSLPNGVKTVGEAAFAGCDGLYSVTLPKTVTKIGYSVFSGCKRLEKVNITQEMLDKTDASVWAGCPATLIINILQDNPVKIKGKTATVRSKALKKKNQTIPASGWKTVTVKIRVK